MGASCQNIVYGLSDPRTGCLMYIGKSSRGLARTKAHLWPSALKRERTRKRHWVVSLLNKDLTPSVDVLEEVERPEDLNAAERFWIASIRATGAKLLNEVDGGEGASGLIRSPEHKEKLRRANLGQTRSPQHREAIHRALLGNKYALGSKRSPEYIESAKKRRLSDETKKKISDQVKGRTYSDEWIERRKEVARANGHKNLGKRRSESDRAKMSQERYRRVYILVADHAGNRFNSLRAAARHHGMSLKRVRKICKQPDKGFLWIERSTD